METFFEKRCIYGRTLASVGVGGRQMCPVSLTYATPEHLKGELLSSCYINVLFTILYPPFPTWQPVFLFFSPAYLIPLPAMNYACTASLPLTDIKIIHIKITAHQLQVEPLRSVFSS